MTNTLYLTNNFNINNDELNKLGEMKLVDFN